MTLTHLSHRQEAFSAAFVRAVAAAAGFRTQEGTTPDDDSVDLTIAARGAGGTVRSPKVDIQLKCVLGLPPAGDEWAYDLKSKNHDDLRHSDYATPRVLVIVAVPESPEAWIESGDSHMLLRHSAWWVSLRGEPASDNTSTVRVRIPRAQRFDVASLHELMRRLAAGGLP